MIYYGLGEKHERQNQILKDYEIKTFNYFIRFLFAYRISQTYQIILNSIMSLKRMHNHTNRGLSRQ